MNLWHCCYWWWQTHFRRHCYCCWWQSHCHCCGCFQWFSKGILGIIVRKLRTWKLHWMHACTRWVNTGGVHLWLRLNIQRISNANPSKMKKPNPYYKCTLHYRTSVVIVTIIRGQVCSPASGQDQRNPMRTVIFGVSYRDTEFIIMDICMLYDYNYVCIGHLKKNLFTVLRSRRKGT